MRARFTALNPRHPMTHMSHRFACAAPATTLAAQPCASTTRCWTPRSLQSASNLAATCCASRRGLAPKSRSFSYACTSTSVSCWRRRFARAHAKAANDSGLSFTAKSIVRPGASAAWHQVWEAMSARELAILTRTSPLAPSPLALSKLRPPSTPMSQFSERQRLVLCHPPGYAHKICGRYHAKSRRRSALVVSADVPSLPPGAWTTVGLKLVLFLPRPQSWRLCCKLQLFSHTGQSSHAEHGVKSRKEGNLAGKGKNFLG